MHVLYKEERKKEDEIERDDMVETLVKTNLLIK